MKTALNPLKNMNDMKNQNTLEVNIKIVEVLFEIIFRINRISICYIVCKVKISEKIRDFN